VHHNDIKKEGDRQQCLCRALFMAVRDMLISELNNPMKKSG